MEIIENKNKLNDLLRGIRSKGYKIGLTPTMGSIHDGHLSLINESRKKNYFSLVSIFINPTQFNDPLDFKNYPKNKKKDIEKLTTIKCDAVYFPLTKELYPNGIKSKKTIFKYRDILCDKFRPGHFDGVTTVIKSLFDIVKPEAAYFGEKDFQQLKLIKELVIKYLLPTNVIGLPSVRSNNGMSLSSRYENFSLEEKIIFNEIAILINQYVDLLKSNHNIDCLQNFTQKLMQYNNVKLDYAEIRDEENLLISNKNITSRLFVALNIGKIRIIDNFILY